MSEKYIVTRLLDSQGSFLPAPQAFGLVELRPSDYDSPREGLAVSKSRKHFGLRDPHPDIDMRISTILLAENSVQAYIEAERVFDEALDILDAGNLGLQRYALSSPGYIRRISDGYIDVIKSHLLASPLPSFTILRGEIQPLTIDQMLLGELGQSELGRQIRRSLHWARKVRWEINPQLRVLFRWFSMEAILMENKNDNIVPRIMVCLGFFKDKAGTLVRRSIIEKQQSFPGYNTLKTRTGEFLDKIHNFRHNSVHGGFRLQDISDEELQKYDKLTSIAFDFVQMIAKRGWQCGAKSCAEFVDFMPIIFEDIEDYSNVCDRLQKHVYPDMISIYR